MRGGLRWGAILVGAWILGGCDGATPGRKASSAEQVTAAHWEYHQSEDKMRGTTSAWASIDSPTALDFDFPYNGDNHATLLYWGSGDFTLQVVKGQFICRLTGDSVAVKVDDGPVVMHRCSEPSNGDTNWITISDWAYSHPDKKSEYLSTALPHANKITVEAQFFQSGPRQLEFNVGNLDFSKIKP